MAYATTGDVAVHLLKSALSPAEEAKANALLPVADYRIDQAVPTVAARIAAGTLNAAVVRAVAAAMVARALPSDEGTTETEESIDDYRRRERREKPSEGMALTDDEIALLAPDEQDADVTAFSILPAGTAPYVTFPPPIGSPYL